ncbi:MAG: N-acetylmuramic acid 6-phosphate etherase [Quinella sp. 2Q5]|nr:N-acetylmuramic acid 6-phosphate etherase [Quinella sp. 2Q5]
MTDNFAELTTECINPATAHIDECTTLEMVTLLNAEDKTVAAAVEKILPDIARAVDAVADSFKRGGRLFYIGAGTSGRLGVLDASECPPTFGVPPEMVQGLIAGGDGALRNAIEGAEDNRTLAADDLTARNFCAADVLCGITASGRTPYVLGGVDFAKTLGAVTIGLSCVENSKLARAVDIALTPVTGAEALTGSTRLKAGTATKMVLNMLTTAAMIKLGKVRGNLMVCVQATNDKLRDRARRITEQLERGNH